MKLWFKKVLIIRFYWVNTLPLLLAVFLPDCCCPIWLLTKMKVWLVKDRYVETLSVYRLVVNSFEEWKKKKKKHFHNPLTFGGCKTSHCFCLSNMRRIILGKDLGLWTAAWHILNVTLYCLFLEDGASRAGNVLWVMGELKTSWDSQGFIVDLGLIDWNSCFLLTVTSQIIIANKM